MSTQTAAPRPEQPPRTQVLIALEGVGIWFDTAPVTELCRDLDLAISAGDFHCLAGRSGSGKTSILCGLRPGWPSPVRAPSPGRGTWSPSCPQTSGPGAGAS